MKYLIILCLTLSFSFASERSEYISRLEAMKDHMIMLRDSLGLGNSIPNLKKFWKKKIKELDYDTLELFESRVAEIEAKKKAEKDKKDLVNNAKAYFKALDCSKLEQEFSKNICYYIQGR